jgi:hypothetical protein
MGNILSLFIFIYLCSFIVDTFCPSTVGSYIMFGALVIVHILAFSKVKKVNRYISATFIVMGAVLLFYSGAKPSDWIYASLNNAPIVCLLLTVSLFTIPLYFEPYHEVLAKNLPRMAKSPFQFYVITLSFTTILASLLNVASLPFVYNLLKEAALKYRKGIVEKCLSRATAIDMLWSPAFISVAIVLGYTDITWFELLSKGLLLAFMGYCVALILGAVEFHEGSQDETALIDSTLKPILAKLFSQLAVLIIFIVALQYLTGKSALVTVPLVSFTGPLLLAFIFRRVSVYRKRLKEYFTYSLSKGYNELILFTSFGFFGYALGLSSVKIYIPIAVKSLGFTSPLSLIPLIVSFTAFPCLCGIHPIVTISTVAIALPLGSIALTKIQMAGALLLGYVIYGLLSPFSGVNLVILGLTKSSPIKVSICQNWLYAAIIIVLATLLLTYC